MTLQAEENLPSGLRLRTAPGAGQVAIVALVGAVALAPCCSPGMMRSLARGLRNLGVPRESIRYEEFAVR